MPEELLTGLADELINRYVPEVERPLILEGLRWHLPGQGSEDDAKQFAALAAVAHRRFHDARQLWAVEHGLSWFEFCRLRREQVGRGEAT